MFVVPVCSWSVPAASWSLLFAGYVLRRVTSSHQFVVVIACIAGSIGHFEGVGVTVTVTVQVPCFLASLRCMLVPTGWNRVYSVDKAHAAAQTRLLSQIARWTKTPARVVSQSHWQEGWPFGGTNYRVAAFWSDIHRAGPVPPQRPETSV